MVERDENGNYVEHIKFKQDTILDIVRDIIIDIVVFFKGFFNTIHNAIIMYNEYEKWIKELHNILETEDDR